ncbi:helix-turn-helix domain-containing protein [Trinickia sp. EG282A]|uniref:helix-turn-helix domain-containing protein n=1 Tax=Trinickia sp. EG282A TaxID=3237013 RepID=UPI0034D26A12
MAENVNARLEAVRGRIANNLKLLRGKQGMSQEALADRAGLHRTQLSQIERGRTNLMLDTLVSLAAALGVDEADLFQERDEKPTPLKSGRKRRTDTPASK